MHGGRPGDMQWLTQVTRGQTLPYMVIWRLVSQVGEKCKTYDLRNMT